jgi:hypothetical protein
MENTNNGINIQLGKHPFCSFFTILFAAFRVPVPMLSLHFVLWLTALFPHSSFVLPHCHCQLPISVHSPFIVEGKIKK